jgi:isopenicillin N synthase-like dioxygenase
VDDLPVIDVSALANATLDAETGAAALDPAVSATAAAIDRACRDRGFFLVTGHGVDLDQLARLDELARAFFALPEARKAAVSMTMGRRAWRGWFPEGGELTSGRADHKEGLYFGAELPADDPRVRAGVPLHGPNLFPAEPAALRPAVLGWMAAMTELGHALVRGIGIGLGVGPRWFAEHLTADPTTLFRIFRYPARPADDEGWGVGEHTDYGLVTILAHDGTPGLEVQATDGGWLPVPAIEGTFVVNLGDMLERMTAGRYRSTPHRVRHAGGPDGRDRLSFPFFFDPGWDAEVRPVPGAERPAHDEGAGAGRWDGASVHAWEGTYGDYLTAKVARVFPDLADELRR